MTVSVAIADVFGCSAWLLVALVALLNCESCEALSCEDGSKSSSSLVGGDAGDDGGETAEPRLVVVEECDGVGSLFDEFKVGRCAKVSS